MIQKIGLLHVIYKKNKENIQKHLGHLIKFAAQHPEFLLFIYPEGAAFKRLQARIETHAGSAADALIGVATAAGAPNLDGLTAEGAVAGLNPDRLPMLDIFDSVEAARHLDTLKDSAFGSVKSAHEAAGPALVDPVH